MSSLAAKIAVGLLLEAKVSLQRPCVAYNAAPAAYSALC